MRLSPAWPAQADAGHAAFFANPRYRRFRATRATAFVLAREALPDCPVAALIAVNPYAAYARVAAALHPWPAVVAGIASAACVDPEAVVDASAWIGPGAVVGPRAVIGARVAIGAGCVIEARIATTAGCEPA